jgi:hypothetical protein
VSHKRNPPAHATKSQHQRCPKTWREREGSFHIGVSFIGVHLGFTCCVLSYRTSLYWFYDRLFNMAVAIKVKPVMRSKGVERQCLEVGDQNNLCHFNEQSTSPCTTARDSQIRTQASLEVF